MSRPLLGDPALLRLERLKLRGQLRRRWRRLRTPGGMLSALGSIALLVFLVRTAAPWTAISPGHWADGLAEPAGVETAEPAGPADPTGVGPAGTSSAPAVSPPAMAAERLRTEGRIRFVVLAFAVVLIVGGSTFPGIHLPQAEVEQLFSAPVGRVDLLRYYLHRDLAVTVGQGLLVAFFVMWRLPTPPLGFVAILLTVGYVNQLGSAVQLLVARLPDRVLDRLRRQRGLVSGTLILGLLALIFGGATEQLLGLLPGSFDDAVTHPALAVVTVPFEPWVRMLMAESAGEFLPWLAGALVVWAAVFEAVAHIDVEHREHSLELSATIARRIRRAAASGGGMLQGEARTGGLGRRAHWIFGRGPTGALVWRKLTILQRKGQGGVVLAMLVLLAVAAGMPLLVPAETGEALGAMGAIDAFTVPFVGLPLVLGILRFDFRAELEQMPVLKAWPLEPWRAFLATLLPATLVASVLLVVGALVASGFGGGASPALLAAIAVHVPPVVLAWLALDNVFFLLAPVRTGPGVPRGSRTLEQSGRAIAFAMARLVALVGLVASTAVAEIVVYLILVELVGLPTILAGAAAATAGVAVLVAWDAVLVLAGGAAFRRFDVSRALD